MLSFIGYLGLAITVAGLILILFTNQNVSIILLIVGVIILLVDFIQNRSSKRKEPESSKMPSQRSAPTSDQFSQDSSTVTPLSDAPSQKSSAQQTSQQSTKETSSQSNQQASVISSQPSESVTQDSTPEEAQLSQPKSPSSQKTELEQRKLIVIRAVAGNPATSKEVLDQLAKSDDPEIRKRVAANKMTPAGILETLSKDQNEEVAHNAKATLDSQQSSR